MNEATDNPMFELKLSLERLAGDQRLILQKLDTLASESRRDVDTVKAMVEQAKRDHESDVKDLKSALDKKVSQDRYDWLERVGYGGALAVIGVIIKMAMGGG